MKMTPVKGTADYLPRQTLLRDYLQQVILETYRSAGFERILTPAIEDLENLEKSDGGDNLNLMFKIMKRGDKLSAALESGEPLADLGLRYDLTLPLSRFYAANRAKLGSTRRSLTRTVKLPMASFLRAAAVVWISSNSQRGDSLPRISMSHWTNSRILPF